MKTLLRPPATYLTPLSSSTHRRLRITKPVYAFIVILVLTLLSAVHGTAATIDLATTITSTPTTGGTAAGNTVVTFSVSTVSPNSATATFNNVAQKITISNVSATLYNALTFSYAPSGTTGSVSYAGTTVTITFPTADLAARATRTQSVSFTVPGNAATATITAAASYTESGNDTDPAQANNDGSAANARSSVNLIPAAPTISSFTPDSGPATGGTTVTVTGTNFVDGGTTATVAGTTAPNVTFVSATQIQLTTPVLASGTVGTIRVTTAGGTATSTQSFTYLPAPTITGISPLYGTIGQTITISGTNLSKASLVTFNGGTGTADDETAAPNAGGTATSVTVVVPTGTLTGTVSVTTPGGVATSSQAFTLPPTLLSLSPAPNALSASRTGVITLTFDQPVTVSSAATIRVFSSQRGGDVTTSVSVDGNTVTIRPDRFFKAGEVISVTVPATVANSYNQTASMRAYQFTVATEKGTGVFTGISDQVTGINPSNQVLTDIDGDNKLDLVVVNYGNGNGNTISVNRYTGGSGAPSLAPRQDFTLGAGQTGSYNIAAGDFDGDGKIDLVTANDRTSNISVLRNTTTGPGPITASSFAASQAFAVGANPSSVAVGDLNNDGKQDLVVSNIGSNNLSVLLNTSTSSTINFAAAQNFAVGTGPYGVAIGDIDGDGKLDIISANSSTNNVSVLRNTTTGTTVSFATAQNFAVGTFPVVVATGDLNQDGKLDLVTVNNSTSNVSVLRNTTTGTTFSFAAKQDFAVGNLPAGLAVGDVNSDGKMDILASNYGSGSTTGNGTTVSVLFNATTSTTSFAFSAQPAVTVGLGPNSVNLGDLDGDGDLDMVTANQGGDNETASIRINSTSAAPLPLPVTLLSFTAQAAGTTAQLTWTTAQELNNAGFRVERSLDGGATFRSIGQVKGQGTTAQAHSYSFTDKAVAAGTVYYRLVQLDLDGTQTPSALQAVRFAAATEVTVYPNPSAATTYLNLSALPAGSYQVTVSDLTGRVVRTFAQPGGVTEALNLAGLPQGSYLLTIQGQGQSLTKRLVKE